MASRSQRATIDEEAILGAALRLFADHGYQATTMDDIGAALGIKGPSLYNHVRSKQDLLVEIMLSTMNTLIRNQRAALDAGGDLSTRLRRTVEAHVRFHAAHPREAFVGNREISSLEPDFRLQVLELRDAYEHRLRSLIAEGCAIGDFSVPSAKLASYAILEMGMGVASWFNPDGELSVDEVAYIYTEIALRMVTERTPSTVT
jgi:AcrR family transcriptional regulator